MRYLDFPESSVGTNCKCHEKQLFVGLRCVIQGLALSLEMLKNNLFLRLNLENPQIATIVLEIMCCNHFALLFLSSFPSFLLSLSSSASLTWKPKKEEKNMKEGKKKKGRDRGRKGKRAKNNGKIRFSNVILGGSGANKNNNNNNNNNSNNNKQQTNNNNNNKQQQRNNNKKTTTATTTTKNNNHNNTSSNTENNNHKNKNKTSNDHKKKTTNNWARQKRDPEKNKKWTKLPPNCSGLKIGPKIAHTPQTLLDYKTGIPEDKNTKFYKMYKEGIFYSHKYSSNWYVHYTAAQCDSKNTIFIRAAPRQTGIALSCPVQKFRCV